MALRGKGAIRTSGFEKAKATINAQIAAVPIITLKSLIAGGLTIQRISQQLTPVDTGNLKASAFTIWATKPGGKTPTFRGPDAAEVRANHAAVVQSEQGKLNTLVPEVEVGHSAAYAIYVHEDLEARHKVGQAKFLEAAASAGMPAVIAAVKTDVVQKTSKVDAKAAGAAFLKGLAT